MPRSASIRMREWVSARLALAMLAVTVMGVLVSSQTWAWGATPSAVGCISAAGPTCPPGSPHIVAASSVPSFMPGLFLGVDAAGYVYEKSFPEETTRSGGVSQLRLAAPIVGVAWADAKGYWLVGADGGVFNFGDARFYGSAAGIPLAKPVVGMAATPTGHGYWLIASDGGVFSFGDAHFYGSLSRLRLNAPIAAMASDGRGYWLVASDGGVFAFGGAHFYGSLSGKRLDSPITGLVAFVVNQVPGSDTGYWLVGKDGGVFSFGKAPFRGSFVGIPSQVVAFGAAYYLEALGPLPPLRPLVLNYYCIATSSGNVYCL